MGKIEKLTPEQEEKLSMYHDKWLPRGLSTDRINKDDAIKICHDVQTKLLNRKETPVVVMRNPIEAWIAVCMFAGNGNIKAQVESQVWAQVESQVWAQVESQVGNQVWAQIVVQVRAQVESQVWAQVWAQVESQVRAQVRDQVEPQVRAQVGAQVRDQFKIFIYPYIAGHNDSSIFSFYDFMQNEMNIKSNLWDKFNVWKETYKLGLLYPLENICIVSEKPTEINMVDGKLHADGKPAIKFDGDFNVWSLNGVRVPQWLAETSESELKIDQYNDLKNADVKAEFVRKFGIERMVDLGKVVDTYTNYKNEWYTKSEYQLIDMSPMFETINYAPYLKMINQTTGVYHLEGVHPNCKTIDDAINYRWGGRKGFMTEMIK